MSSRRRSVKIGLQDSPNHVAAWEVHNASFSSNEQPNKSATFWYSLSAAAVHDFGTTSVEISRVSQSALTARRFQPLSESWICLLATNGGPFLISLMAIFMSASIGANWIFSLCSTASRGATRQSRLFGFSWRLLPFARRQVKAYECSCPSYVDLHTCSTSLSR